MLDKNTQISQRDTPICWYKSERGIKQVLVSINFSLRLHMGLWRIYVCIHVYIHALILFASFVLIWLKSVNLIKIRSTSKHIELNIIHTLSLKSEFIAACPYRGVTFLIFCSPKEEDDLGRSVCCTNQNKKRLGVLFLGQIYLQILNISQSHQCCACDAIPGRSSEFVTKRN